VCVFLFSFPLLSLMLPCHTRVFGISFGQCIGEGDALQLLSETRPSLSDQQARRAVTAIFRACRTTLASVSSSQSASPALGSLNAHCLAVSAAHSLALQTNASGALVSSRAPVSSSAPLVSTSSPGTRHLAPVTIAVDSTASAFLQSSPSLQSSSASPALQTNDLGGVGVSSNLVGGSPSSTHHPAPVLHRARERASSIPSNTGTSSASANFSSTTVLGLVEGSAAGFAPLVLPPSFSPMQPRMRHDASAALSSAASSATPSPRLSPASSPRRTDALHQHQYHQLADMGAAGGALGIHSMQLNSMIAAGKDTVLFSRFCKAALLFSHARGTVGADMDFEFALI
jgi:hypothetical protein